MKLLASDYDGTLRLGERVAPSTVKAVREFQKRGNLFGLVTGRALNMIYDEIRDNGIEPDFILSSNGAMLTDKNRQVLSAFPIPFEIGVKLLDELKVMGFRQYGACDGFRYCYYDGGRNLDDPDRALYPNLEVSQQELIARGSIISFYSRGRNREHTAELQQQLQARFGQYVDSFLNRNTLDIVARGISKKTGVELAASAFACPHPYVIGDDFNDLPMIEEFRGFAMSGGIQEAKDAASQIFDTVDDCLKYLESI